MENFKFTKDWQKYPGFYEKNFYDIKLSNGHIHIACYPNNGKFILMDSSSVVKEEDVIEIRLTHDQRFEE